MILNLMHHFKYSAIVLKKVRIVYDIQYSPRCYYQALICHSDKVSVILSTVDNSHTSSRNYLTVSSTLDYSLSCRKIDAAGPNPVAWMTVTVVSRHLCRKCQRC